MSKRKKAVASFASPGDARASRPGGWESKGKEEQRDLKEVPRRLRSSCARQGRNSLVSLREPSSDLPVPALRLDSFTPRRGS